MSCTPSREWVKNPMPHREKQWKNVPVFSLAFVEGNNPPGGFIATVQVTDYQEG